MENFHVRPRKFLERDYEEIQLANLLAEVEATIRCSEKVLKKPQ